MVAAPGMARSPPTSTAGIALDGVEPTGGDPMPARATSGVSPPGQSIIDAASAMAAPSASTSTASCAGDSIAVRGRGPGSDSPCSRCAGRSCGGSGGTHAVAVITGNAEDATARAGTDAGIATTSSRLGISAAGGAGGAGCIDFSTAGSGKAAPQLWQKCDSALFMARHCGQITRINPAPQALQ